jgi:hypothetical protein
MIMKKLEKIFLSMIVLTGVSSMAQVKIGNNPTTMNPNSILEIESTTKGFLLPRLALTGTSTANPLNAHVAGMVVFNTATTGDVLPGFYFNDGSKWVKAADATIKENTIAQGTIAQYWRGDKTWQVLDKAAVGLGDVNNTTDLAKPISTLTQGALDLKAPLASPSFTGDAKAETATAGDSDTSVATTAFVTGAITTAATLDATDLLKGKIQLAGDLAGTAAAPEVGVGKITSDKILNATIKAEDFSSMSATSGQILKYNGTIWAPAEDASAPTKLVSKTASYTLLATDDSLLVSVPNGGATVTLPAASDNNGKIFTIKKIDNDSDVLTFNVDVKVTESESFTTLNYSTTLKIQSDGSNWWLIN